ncbi:hypothetical protein B0H19DRAFT_92596 [Mycena capillaripes]|nr:hypothetical protein B0H19DRAFT_92596 [Mycena capillaripes]
MRFAVDDRLEDQGVLGFAVQDNVVLSASSCVNSDDSPIAAGIDVAVRNGISLARVYLEREARDSVNRPIVLETDIPPPASTAVNATPYTIWSIELKREEFFSSYTVGAKVDGVESTRNSAYIVSTPCSARVFR